MPPKKRKAATQTEGKSEKRSKRDNSPEETPLSPIEHDVDGSQVPWVVPTQNSATLDPDHNEAITNYAQSLYAQPWNSLRTTQEPLRFPLLRSPIYKKRTANSTPGPNESSAALRRVFDAIKRDTGGTVDEARNDYRRDRFSGAFTVAPESAVVASEGQGNLVLSLTEDYTLQSDSTVRNGDLTTNAHLNIARRSPPGEPEIGYFIELPLGGTVTVNNRTYMNRDVAADGQADTAPPFFIGPLNRFTIIELLSQPVFFFRGLGDMDFTDVLASRKDHRPTVEELERRDDNGDVDAANVEIIWTPVHQKSVLTPPERPTTPKAQPELVVRAPEPKQIEYDDNYTDQDGRQIEPSAYLRSRLYGPRETRNNDIVSRVLMSINDRQEAMAGYSVVLDGHNHALRPGRTMLAPLHHPKREYHVLLLFHLNEARKITLRVLDPMAWQTDLVGRSEIYNRAQQLLIDRQWWRNVFATEVELRAAFPESGKWVPCAQESETAEANALTILNVWALAMNMELNVSFAVPNEAKRVEFFTQAGWLFDRALHDLLDWKLLLAFLQSMKYIVFRDGDQADESFNSLFDERPEDIEAEAGPARVNANLPPRNRRFDLKKRGFALLVAQQIGHDGNEPSPRTQADIELSANTSDVRLKDGLPHTALFHRDGFSADFRQEVLPILVGLGKWTLSDTQDELQARFKEVYSPTDDAEVEGDGGDARSSPASHGHESPAEVSEDPLAAAIQSAIEVAQTEAAQSTAGVTQTEKSTIEVTQTEESTIQVTQTETVQHAIENTQTDVTHSPPESTIAPTGENEPTHEGNELSEVKESASYGKTSPPRGTNPSAPGTKSTPEFVNPPPTGEVDTASPGKPEEPDKSDDPSAVTDPADAIEVAPGGDLVPADPCVAFRALRNEQKNTAKRVKDLKDFRRHNKVTVTTKFRKWLDDTEVALSIASVTMAITEMQDAHQGFGFVAPGSTPVLLNAMNWDTLPTIRPGRPLLVPLNIDSHFILLVVQLNDAQQITFSVMDSEAYHLVAERRDLVNVWARRITATSAWKRDVFPGNPRFGDVIQLHTTWVPTAQQCSDCYCGYHVILNAWSLALGLEPDPAVQLDWNDEFYRNLQDVVHLARMGRADWRMIHNFLRCRRFVLDDEVPEDRRFGQTVELRNEMTALDRVDDIRAIESVYKDIRPLAELRQVNRCRLPPGGSQHDQPGAFPSDLWSQETRGTHVRTLQRRLKLKLQSTTNELAAAAEASRHDRGEWIRADLERNTPGWRAARPEDIADAIGEYVEEWRAGYSELLNAAPRETSEDMIDFYNYILRGDFFGPALQTEAFQPRGLDWKGKQKVRPAHQTSLNGTDVNLAIAAVVEAIDRRQKERHVPTLKNTRFAGGLSLAVSGSIEMALANHPDVMTGAASRPRRCFLMPVLVAGEVSAELAAWRRERGLKPTASGAAGHHLLAVIQEDEDEELGTSFTIYLYDSSRHILEGSSGFLQTVIERALEHLEWSTHRNAGDEPVTVGMTIEMEETPQQQKGGGWRCGPHTVINAWILAMGLHPCRRAEYSDEIYQEFRTLARAAVGGLLDWRTLVSWLFNRKLSSERRFSAVHESRRFDSTRYWRNDAALQQRIQEIRETDDLPLETLTEAAAPYDHENNPNHNDNRPDRGSDAGEEDELYRGWEDPELSLASRRRSETMHSRIHDALVFLDAWDAGSDDVEMLDADNGEEECTTKMLLRPSLLAPRTIHIPTPTSYLRARLFSLLNPTQRSHINRLFDPIRQPNDLHTLTMLNAADNRTLITLWSAKWCQTCQAIRPVILRMLEEEKVGEREGGLGFVEVEMDSTLIGDLPVTYRISSMPTLLAFSRQEAQFDTRLTKPDEMRNEEFLREWLLNEARGGGRAGGGGGSIFGW
ncbi:hypothetical protein EK21DRAFT_60679 [Setomelanomma holmii]|uniref:Thioredoxin domain-containing protein n=1 Tax=Setomelanomma holmii TaxID=210430 RepID=A0A9P4HDZ9_9PLEO|nr:hypothetical protein EK21DRAFT_60679 [Setomelanomma holmii]